MKALLLTSLLLSASPPELPARLWVKSPTLTFTQGYLVAVHEGTLWFKPNPDSGHDGPWAPLPPDGLPSPSASMAAWKELAEALVPVPLHGFTRPSRVVRVTADGDNVFAVSAEGQGYYLKLSTMQWNDTWGPVGRRAPLMLDFQPRDLAMSHRKIPYQDVDGNTHPVTAGVTTLYALSADGRELRYADPWLPGGFSRQICMPLQGRVIGASLSASASTVMVIDPSGRVFTRLADFDTLGLDPALPYSWKRAQREGALGAVRSLPPEPWREHGRPPGPATTRIAILQTGQTNADRELRVAGEGGYWTKRIDSKEWTLQKVPEKLGGDPVDALAQSEGPTRAVGPWEGKAEWAKFKGVKASLEAFDAHCSPATLLLQRGPEKVELELHFHDVLVDLKAKKGERTLKGALLIPEAGLSSTFLAKDVLELFGGEKALEVTLAVSPRALKVAQVVALKKKGALAVTLALNAR